MSFFVTKYPQGTFCYADVASTDIAATNTFMTGLMGWTARTMPTPQGPEYTQFMLGDKVTAGGMQMPPDMKGVPSMWNNYISVDNVDEMVKKAVELGAQIAMPAMDVMEAGRMVGIQDPTGAHVFFWQAKQHIGAGVVNTAGAMSWNELYTKDIEKAKDFYSKLFGWTYETSTSNGMEYTTIKNVNGRMNGGMLAITAEMGPMPPKWMPYFTVANIDEALKKTAELGGKVWEGPIEISAGKFGIVGDSTGAGFMIIEMPHPQEWIE